jgi:hypothetical protein
MELQINFLEEIILDLFLNLYLVLQNLEILALLIQYDFSTYIVFELSYNHIYIFFNLHVIIYSYINIHMLIY